MVRGRGRVERRVVVDSGDVVRDGLAVGQGLARHAVVVTVEAVRVGRVVVVDRLRVLLVIEVAAVLVVDSGCERRPRPGADGRQQRQPAEGGDVEATGPASGAVSRHDDSPE